MCSLVVEFLTSTHKVLEITKIKNLLQARDLAISGGRRGEFEEKQDSNIVSRLYPEDIMNCKMENSK